MIKKQIYITIYDDGSCGITGSITPDQADEVYDDNLDYGVRVVMPKNVAVQLAKSILHIASKTKICVK